MNNNKRLSLNFGSNSIQLRKKLELLRKIYNIDVNTKIIEHIVDMEIMRHDLIL